MVICSDGLPHHRGVGIRRRSFRRWSNSQLGLQKPYDAYEEDFDVRLASGELYHADSMPLVDSLKYTTPMGREVFGGGGIAPDVFVAWDSTGTSGWVSEWIWTGVLRDAVFSWMDRHREDLEACNAVRDIESLDAWTQDVVAVVREEAERGGWSWRNPDREEEAKLRHRFLAQVVRTLWGESASYEVLMDGDEAVARALHALTEESNFTQANGAVSLNLTTFESNQNNESHGF